MARILGIDYGAKRCGIAATDPLQIIVSPISTEATEHILTFLKSYFVQEDVEKVVIGLPTHSDGSFTHLKPNIDNFAAKLKNLYPELEIDFQDESFTSLEAKNIILNSGKKKKARRNKENIDLVSAVLILQRYLKHI
jgi:putative Holliday junction resolvase